MSGKSPAEQDTSAIAFGAFQLDLMPLQAYILVYWPQYVGKIWKCCIEEDRSIRIIWSDDDWDCVGVLPDELAFATCSFPTHFLLEICQATFVGTPKAIATLEQLQEQLLTSQRSLYDFITSSGASMRAKLRPVDNT